MKKKKKKREHDPSKEVEKLHEEGGSNKKGIYLISSGDEDCSKGMKSMNYSICILLCVCNLKGKIHSKVCGNQIFGPYYLPAKTVHG